MNLLLKMLRLVRLSQPRMPLIMGRRHCGGRPDPVEVGGKAVRVPASVVTLPGGQSLAGGLEQIYSNAYILDAPNQRQCFKMNSRYVFAQHRALREEIIEAQKRNFKTIGYTIVGVPGLNYLGVIYDIRLFMVLLPLVVLGSYLLYLSDHVAIRRCGAFVKTMIEPVIDSDTPKWETWLDSKSNTSQSSSRRITESLLMLGLSVIFMLYYTAASYISVTHISSRYGPAWYGLAIGIYSFIGIFMIYYTRVVGLEVKSLGSITQNTSSDTH
ncbi:MAG: hypothetical protein AAF970_00275 [Bacteroidota bacterium]